MKDYDFDLFVIGAGSGGVRASRLAAQTGARVAVAEERFIGGTCVNVGCVPKKLFYYASHFRDEAADAAAYGWDMAEPQFDWPRLIRNKDTEIRRLNDIYRNLLIKNNVTLLENRASLVDAHTIHVGNRTVTARYILIATGGRATVPQFPGCEHVITSDEAFYLPKLPQKPLIVGGGYIATEFAGIFHGLGAKVTQLYRGALFLRGFDEDIARALAEQMRNKGIDLRFCVNVTKIEKTADAQYRATLTDDSTIESDCIMYATGRKPNTQGIGLEKAGVQRNDLDAVVVDRYSRTSVDNIYAVGDCTDRMNLTPVALAEAMAFVRTVFENNPTEMNYCDIPSAVFSQPTLACVGLTEAQACAEYGEADFYCSTFRPLKYTLPHRDEPCLIKVIVHPKTERVVGVHLLAPDAGEIVQGLAIAMKCGLTKPILDSTIGIHPTTAEEFVTLKPRLNV